MAKLFCDLRVQGIHLARELIGTPKGPRLSGHGAANSRTIGAAVHFIFESKVELEVEVGI